MDIEIILKQLMELNVQYQIIKHPPVYTIEDVTQISNLDFDKIIKNLFVRDDKKENYYLLLIKNNKRINLNKLRKEINSRRLTFANAEELDHYFGLKAGAVSPLGILNDQERKVKVLIDQDLKTMDLVGIHPNINTATLLLPLPDLIRVIENHGNLVKFVAIS